MKKIVLALITLATTLQVASACIIAVDSNVEIALLQNVYQFSPSQLTTNTSLADVGIRLVGETTTVNDPVFGETKKLTVAKMKADIYEKGQIVESTRYHNIEEIGTDSAFGKNIKKSLQKVGCAI